MKYEYLTAFDIITPNQMHVWEDRMPTQKNWDMNLIILVYYGDSSPSETTERLALSHLWIYKQN